MNLSVLEEWVGQMGLPRGVQLHIAPVRDLLQWLQVRTGVRSVPYVADSSPVPFFRQ